jgi:hypothetical protein
LATSFRHAWHPGTGGVTRPCRAELTGVAEARLGSGAEDAVAPCSRRALAVEHYSPAGSLPTSSRTSTGLEEQLIPFGKELLAWLEICGSRYRNPLALESLQPMAKHWAVLFVQDVQADVYLQLRRYAQDMSIESRMVKTAKRQSIRHDRLALG